MKYKPLSYCLFLSTGSKKLVVEPSRISSPWLYNKQKNKTTTRKNTSRTERSIERNTWPQNAEDNNRERRWLPVGPLVHKMSVL